MSGDPTLRRPRKMDWQNSHYHANIKLLELDNETPASRRKILYKLSTRDLVMKLPAFQHWSPAVDGDFIPSEVDLGMLSNGFGSVGRPDWCKQIMTGDTFQDVSTGFPIFHFILREAKSRRALFLKVE
jgi:hypothetical protein